MMKKKLRKRILALIIVPILFLFCSYSLMYIVGRPVIQFVTSSLNIFLLNDAPQFNHQPTEIAINVDNDDLVVNSNNELPSSEVKYPRGGDMYGRIIMEELRIDVPLYLGDTNEILRYGAGQFMGSVYPGELGTSLIGGHNTDGFGRLIGAQVGDVVQVPTTYANYTYQVTDVSIQNKDAVDIQSILGQRDESLLLLYTCYPVDSIGMTDDRLFVTCERIDGPVINEQE